MAKKKVFEFPDELKAAQAELEAARAAYVEYRNSLPKWAEPVPERTVGGTVLAAEPGWSEEQRTEERRLLEAERQAAHAVSAHGFWAQLPTGDVVDARMALKHLEPAAA